MSALAIAGSALASPKLLDRVNRQENAAHVFGSPYPADHDIGPYGGAWHCTNYAYAKLERLEKAGIPAGRLRVVAVHTELRDPAPYDHAVLLVQTADDGEWVLDSRFPKPARRANLVDFVGYRFTDLTLDDPTAAKWAHGGLVFVGAIPR